MCVVLSITHFNNVKGDLVNSGAKNRADLRFEPGLDYVYHRGTLFNSFAASFKKSFYAL